MVDLNSLISNLEDDSPFEEIPVDLDTFMTEDYLNMDSYIQLSPLQKDVINYSTQIFDLDTLKQAYGATKGKHIYKYTKEEIINVLGKGSGKDLMAEISCAYVVYKLLCLKDPAKFFGKPPGDAFDIVNVAINADQAQRVFFKGFTNIIKRAPWFAGKVVAPKQRVYEFEKSISVHSGHSEMEAFEGLNCIMVILDEISGFAMEASQGSNTDVSPAEATYNMYRASLTSRFPEQGKLIMLSFPRSTTDFISKKYRDSIGTMDRIEKSVELAINPDYPIDSPGNSLTIEWTEDHIIEYTRPGVWALRRPSWEINPKRKIEDYKSDFLQNYKDAKGRFAAEPTDGSEGFFPNHDVIENSLRRRNGVNEDTGMFETWLKPREEKEYFMHIDLARKHDRAVAAIAHVDRWVYQEIFPGQFENLPHVIVDAYKYWTPSRETQINFIDVKNFPLDLARMGFNIEVITLDQWDSGQMTDYFNGVGMRSEKLSVGLAQYNDLKLMMNESRVHIPHSPILEKEMHQLKYTKNLKNVDHPHKGGKDIADAVAGAVFNAATRSHSDHGSEAEVLTLDDVHARMEVDKRHAAAGLKPEKNITNGWDVYVL